MILPYERLLSLCGTLNLPFVAQDIAAALRKAYWHEAAYSDFLEALLKMEASGRQVRKQSLLTPPGRLLGDPDPGGLR